MIDELLPILKEDLASLTREELEAKVLQLDAEAMSLHKELEFLSEMSDVNEPYISEESVIDFGENGWNFAPPHHTALEGKILSKREKRIKDGIAKLEALRNAPPKKIQTEGQAAKLIDALESELKELRTCLNNIEEVVKKDVCWRTDKGLKSELYSDFYNAKFNRDKLSAGSIAESEKFSSTRASLRLLQEENAMLKDALKAVGMKWYEVAYARRKRVAEGYNDDYKAAVPVGG